MSDDMATTHRALSALVTPVDAKITVRKDPTKPYVGLENIPSRGAHLVGWALASSSISTNSIFQAGDVLFGKLRPNLRKCIVAPFDGYCSTDILVLRSNEGVDPSFAGKVLRTEHVGAAAEMTSVGTKMPRTSWKHLSELEVFCPGLPEQSKIAQILDTLDTAIHETEAIITKLKAVKQGLLHDLMTHGIGANGELRPPQVEAPHLYKESPLGWIPKEWDTDILGDTIDHVMDFRGRTPKKLGMDWAGGEILALSANNVQPGGIDISREAYFGSEKLYRKWMTNGDTRKGDVLLTMEAPLGNIAQIPDDSKYILSQRVIALRFKRLRVLNDFAFWQMQGTEFQQAMVRRSTGSTATGIQRAELVKLDFRVPPVAEQSLIAERMFAIESALINESLALEKQKMEKAGLMDDLLTGSIRVTPLLAPTEHEMEGRV
jgi:type I restriction enzyme S subunit